MTGIPSYAELRRAVHDAATDLNHPTKVSDGGEPARFGRVVYFDGGHVGVLVDGTYLIAEGDSHELSVWALAHHLDLTPHAPADVSVWTVDVGYFRQRCTGQ